jgi:hypothetical protein
MDIPLTLRILSWNIGKRSFQCVKTIQEQISPIDIFLFQEWSDKKHLDLREYLGGDFSIFASSNQRLTDNCMVCAIRTKIVNGSPKSWEDFTFGDRNKDSWRPHLFFVSAQVGNSTITIANIHCAIGRGNVKDVIKIINEKMPDIYGGDFNELPAATCCLPGTYHTGDYSDNAGGTIFYSNKWEPIDWIGSHSSDDVRPVTINCPWIIRDHRPVCCDITIWGSF